MLNFTRSIYYKIKPKVQYFGFKFFGSQNLIPKLSCPHLFRLQVQSILAYFNFGRNLISILVCTSRCSWYLWYIGICVYCVSVYLCVYQFRNSKISRYQGSKLSRFQGSKASRFCDIQVSKAIKEF
jgi:hypothetical protein